MRAYSPRLSVTNVPKRAIVPAMKTDSERGEWGAWAYRTRTRLGLSLEQVAADVGYSDGAMRKTEAGSPGYRPPSRPIMRALPDYYRSRAAERGVVIDPAPVQEPPVITGVLGATTAPATAAFTGDVAEAIRDQTRVMAELVDELRSAREQAQPDLAEVVARSVEAALRAAGVPAASSEPSRSVAPQQDPV